MSEEFTPEHQHEVQRQLGRCLLRLQQYERLMKAMLSVHRLSGPVQELEARRVDGVQRYASKSLGQLVDALFKSYAVPEGTQREATDEELPPEGGMSVSFAFQMQFEAQRFEDVKAAVETLVRMRNELVHHFIERFDLWTSAGCEAALTHLQEAYARIERHYTELREWAEHMDKARVMAAEFAQSPAFHDLLVDGIAPDGQVDWDRAGIVRALKDAVPQGAPEGWMRLDAALVWMALHHPEQVPERYGCKSWPQVLNESRAFRLEYREETGSSTDRKAAWFRSLA